MLLISIFLLLISPNLAQARNITLCAEAWMPYTIKDSKGAINSGITFDILKKALEDIGHTLTVEEVNYADRCMALGRNGTIDGSLFTTEVGKSPKMYYLDKALEYWILNAIVPQDSPKKKFDSLSQFTDERIGFTRGYGYPADIKNFKKWNIEEESEVILNLRKLSAKRIDVYIDDPYQAAHLAKTENLRLKILYPAVTMMPTYVELKSSVLHNRLNKKINELFANGYVDQIYTKYTGKSFKDFLKGPNL